MRFIDINDYFYELPEEKIATYPLAQKDTSKLIVYQKKEIKSLIFNQLAEFLPNETLLIFNNTRVMPVRLIFEREIEIFCLTPLKPSVDFGDALAAKGPVEWECLVGRARKWKSGQIICIEGAEITLKATQTEKRKGDGQDTFAVRFEWAPESLSFGEILETLGHTPLPPYIRRQDDANDKINYQTIFAKYPGAVAAPTAGLHFTPEVIQSLAIKGIQTTGITLHVGAGTFRPVVVSNAAEHKMHAEYFEVSQETLAAICAARARNAPIVAVGTTALRTLESIFYALAQEQPSKVSQWPEAPADYASMDEALSYGLARLRQMDTPNLFGQTALMITPGFPFRLCDGLITNFHQPVSTLLLLVSAFVGEDWRKIYDYALENNYRFLSYGDSSLLWRGK